MKERFQGSNAGQLVRAMKNQTLVGQDEALAAALAASGTLIEFQSGDQLIEQGTADNDIYFVVYGAVSIIVNGAQINTRKAGEAVGEMAAVEPSLPRSATVRALEPTVALKVANDRFLAVAEAHPKIWMPIAQDLARRLFQRNQTIALSNNSPKLFIISSSEAKDLAYAMHTGLGPDVFSRVWDQGVFWAGGYPLEALEQQVAESDFAVAIAEPDDIVESRGTRAPTLRDNVLFELGLFMGKLSRHRSILVHPRIKELRLPSDLQGLTAIPYDAHGASPATRMEPVCDQIRSQVARLGVKVFGQT